MLDRAGTVTLCYTEVGRRGAAFSYEQRLVETTDWCDGAPVLTGWTSPRKSVAADGVHHRASSQSRRVEGHIDGAGLVAANPAASPDQTYCWWVTCDPDVVSLVDLPGAAAASQAERRARVGSAPAPFFALAVDGDQAMIPARSPQGKHRRPTPSGGS
ncbi:hypothetical protein [Sphingomonas sp.]|uniref:hypothetical protein n=1 Tax=Sphingomonas sp. TaxID=28214 RepID=UPI003CC59977